MKKNQTRRELFSTGVSVGAAVALSGISMPAIAQTTKKTFTFAGIGAPPEFGAVAYKWFSEEVTKRSGGELEITFHGGTLLTKEMETMPALKVGNVQISSPAGAAPTVFPDIEVLSLPYLLRDYGHSAAVMNGPIGKHFASKFEQQLGLRMLILHDNGFRHFFNSRRPITVPADLRGLKIRSVPTKINVDTLNLLGANAVAIPWGEMVSALQTGVADGADLPMLNMVPSRIWEFSKFVSVSFHSYQPMYVAMNLDAWNSLTPALQRLVTDVAAETSKNIATELAKVDSLDAAKAALGPHGMTVNGADLGAFQKMARERIWPQYESKYGNLIEEIAKVKA
jgi:TRAP-type transport system periplasmic protein